MKRLLQFGVLIWCLLYGVAAFSTVNCIPNQGFGSNPPTTVCASTYPDNGSDHNHVLFTWTTAVAADSHVFIAIPQSDLTGPSVSREVCDGASDCSTSALVTSHSVLVDGFVPNATYGYYVASCTSGPGCVRGSTNWSSSPFGKPNQSLTTFVTPDTNGSHAFDFKIYFSGPHAGPARGYAYNFPINGFKTDGPNSAYTVISDLKIDGVDCLPLLTAGTTCNMHFTVQVLCNNNEIVSSGTNNYDTHMLVGGQAFCYSPLIGYEAVQIRVKVDTSVTLASHTLQASVLQQDGSGVTISPTRTATYTFTPEAVPTYAYVPPTVFVPVPNQAAWTANIFGTDVATGHATTGIISNYVGLMTANHSAQGIYSNDNGSSVEYDINPTGVLTYHGVDIALDISDMISGVTAAFQANHAYNYGDKICTNGGGGCVAGTNYVLIVTDSAGCVSGPAQGTVPAPASYVLSGSCHFGNAGNPDFWLQMAERTGNQHVDFLLNLGTNTIWQEWAGFAPLQLCERRNLICSGSQDAIAIQYMMYPFVTGHGAMVRQKSQFTPIAIGVDTLRTLPYDTEDFVAQWMITNIKPVDGGVDEIEIRKQMIVETIKDKIGYSLHDGVNSTYACCNSYPNFDDGLGDEALTWICTAEKAQTGTCDPITPVTIKAHADWMYSHEFNLTGNDFAFPYSPWTVPFNNQVYNYRQTSLNNLYAPEILWLWAYTGDTCTLPTSGVACLTAADTMHRHTFDNPVGGAISGKEGSQWYKLEQDYELMHAGTRTAYQMSFLPLYNMPSPFPNKMEPFAQGEWPTKPTAVCNSNSCTVTWYSDVNYTGLIDNGAFIKYGTNPSGITTVFTCPGGFNSLFNANIGMYKNVCTVTSLASATTYYYGVALTNAGSGTGYTQYDITLNSPGPYRMTTTGSSLTITGTLPNGHVGTSYTGTLGCSGGTPPCTFTTTLCIGAACMSHDVKGLTMSTSGIYSGTPTQAGSAGLNVHVIDNVGVQTNRLFPIMISPSTPTGGLTVQGMFIYGMKIQ